MPVSGISRVTPPMMRNVWRPMITVSPVASSVPNGSRDRSAMWSPRATRSANKQQDRNRADEPELLTERREDEVGLDPALDEVGPAAAEPFDRRCPPVPSANSDCAIWNPDPSIRLHGSSHAAIAALHVRERLVREHAFRRRTTSKPVTTYAARAVAAYSITMKSGEEQHRRAEVALEHHDRERDCPRDDDRAEVSRRRDHPGPTRAVAAVRTSRLLAR